MPFDLNLKTEDIQSLSSREALAAFFRALGYNTEARIKQSAGNLGIAAENWRGKSARRAACGA
jgi:hypothetical protein